MTDRDYPWYAEIQNSRKIEQGDLIPQCPLVVPPEDLTKETTPDVHITVSDVIILSQSCDLLNDKLDIVLVCPHYSYEEFYNGLKTKDIPKYGKFKKYLSQGRYPAYHLLEKHPGFLEELQVVDFKNVYGIKLEALRNIAESIDRRIRLLPPYREHLSQAFARYFMRVGLPQDIAL